MASINDKLHCCSHLLYWKLIFVCTDRDTLLRHGYFRLRTAAAYAYDDIKEQTATGLQHIMNNRSVIEIGITLASSFVVIPYNGIYKELSFLKSFF